MTTMGRFRVRWPKSQKLVGDTGDILAARAIQRINPGTAIYRLEEDGRETVMSYPVPDAPKEPKESSK